LEFNRILEETLLEESGFLVECAVHGLEAVEAVKSHPAGYYDLILMDIQMPVMNGYEATKAIRAMKDKGSLPIVALSANARDEDRLMSRNSGMDDHGAKPFEIDALVAVINEHIAAKST
jgi:CheY-like chemotaxis protein